MKKYLIKLFSAKELKKEIIKREFNLDYPNLDFDEIKRLWQTIFKENPKILDFIKYRKNQLLHSIISGNNKNDDVASVISEWNLIESLSSDVSEETTLQKKEVEEKDIDKIFEKIKRSLFNNK